MIRGVTEPVRPEDMRISDTERGAVQDRLRRAHDIGQLDLGEFDERVQVRLGRPHPRRARTRHRRPPGASRPEPGRRPVFSDTGGGVTMRVLTIVWGSLDRRELHGVGADRGEHRQLRSTPGGSGSRYRPAPCSRCSTPRGSAARPATAEHRFRPLSRVHEEAERVPGRVKEHPHVLLRLELGERGARVQRVGDGALRGPRPRCPGGAASAVARSRRARRVARSAPRAGTTAPARRRAGGA